MDGSGDLSADALARPMPPQPHPYLSQMARFCDGSLHERRRAAVLRALPAAEVLEPAARRAVEAALSDPIDVVPLAFSVPVAVLGDAMGVGHRNEAIAALVEQGIVRPTLPDVARTSVLFQARDATAALVLAALGSGSRPEDVSPVTRTRRAPTTWVSLAGVPYGAGRHECPGREHALAIARGMLAALTGFVVVERGPALVRPNMTFVARLVMVRR